jgi:tetratricopeptide (TPR) repeat protein
MPLIRQALDGALRMEYAEAETLLLGGLPPSNPAQAYYAGTVCMNRFLDWGDTAAFTRAERHWDRLSPHGDPSPLYRNAPPDEVRLYRGLAGFQLSYAATLRGEHLRPATLALAARRQLLSLERPEARATLMLYDYYRGQILGKLPFVGEKEFPVKAFRQAADASPLRDLFLSSLFWVFLEKGKEKAGPVESRTENLASALRIADAFLDRYPGNRMGREMRGSALYWAGRFQDAREEYENLREDYRKLRKSPERLPLGYYRATGNLARVYAALGMRPEAEARLAEWKRAERSGTGPWLPASLKEDLGKL